MSLPFPTLTPFKEPAHNDLPPSKEQARETVICFSPNKALLEFVVWTHQFLLIKESKNLTQ